MGGFGQLLEDESQLAFILNNILGIHSCKLTNRHGTSTILMVFTRISRKEFSWAMSVSFREGIPCLDLL